MIVLKNSKYSFRYSNIVEISRVKTTTYGKSSFKYTAAVLWNDLPDDFRKIANFNQFKNILLSWNGNECKCNACKKKLISSRSFQFLYYLYLFIF